MKIRSFPWAVCSPNSIRQSPSRINAGLSHFKQSIWKQKDNKTKREGKKNLISYLWANDAEMQRSSNPSCPHRLLTSPGPALHHTANQHCPDQTSNITSCPATREPPQTADKSRCHQKPDWRQASDNCDWETSFTTCTVDNRDPSICRWMTSKVMKYVFQWDPDDVIGVLYQQSFSLQLQTEA